MSKDFLLEIGAEEIPASYITSAMQQLTSNLINIFAENKISHEKIGSYSTPRRFTLLVQGVSEMQEDIASEVMGPPKRAAFDAAGNPTQAAAGFAKNQGVEVSDLQIVVTPKGEYISVKKLIKGREVKNVLPELIVKLVTSLNWPKSMRWYDDFRFPRPIRSLLCLFGNETVSFAVSDVTSKNITFGHRTLSPEGNIVSEPAKYLPLLREKYVLADCEERKAVLLKQLTALAAKAGGMVNLDAQVLEENLNTVEYPTAMLGRFEERYLALPRELLLQVMEKTQKYFSVKSSDGTKLLPYFIAVKNGDSTAVEEIISGNERVLKARFEDAEFFFKEDKKTTLLSKREKLKTVSFQDKLGSMLDKSERLIKLAGAAKQLLKLSNYEDIKLAAELAKIDLTTGMVKEFTELQGIMGREYGLSDGIKKEVAMAISEHYLPRFLGDALPSTETGMAVAILDKIDTISGCFLAGLIPTGSQDPYGLRRNALGVINIILKNNNDFYLEELVNASLDTYPEKLNPHKGKVLNEIMLFIKGRIEGLLLEKKIRYDVVNALLERNYDNLTITFKKAEELNKLAKETDFNKVITTFSRVINIIPKHEHSSGDFEDANPHLFKTQEEKELHLAVEKRKLDFLKIIENHEYTSAFKILKELMPAIDAFFEKVMVMDKDEAVKNNRITLLKHLNMMFQKIADFSKIVTQ